MTNGLLPALGGFGFVSIGIVTLAIPLLTAALVWPMRGVAPAAPITGALGKVISAVALPGIGLAFASLTYGATTAFAVLYFTERGWELAWPSFTAFAIALIVARLAFGHVPDRMGGAKAALIFVIVQRRLAWH